MNEQIWWFVTRSSGIVAWALLTLSVCWGLMLSTKATAKATQPARVLDLHRFFGGLAVVFTGLHLAGLVADNYVHFGWAEILIPWASAWKPTAVAWGVIGFYLLLTIEITSLLMKRLPRAVWKHIHRTSLALYIFATYHGIQAGTDTGNPWYQIAMLASINIVAFLVVILVLAHKKAAARSASDDATAGHPRPAHRRAA